MTRNQIINLLISWAELNESTAEIHARSAKQMRLIAEALNEVPALIDGEPQKK